ncbi:TIGR02452 family protein [Fodinibius sp.]|uniref:TIGR02452 family protein n=1 Tax=Fodinibius sp. TaxID=1872440 RepID=UPI002ACDFC96|nr:TIGR02452 family protein [Fodinibius sp.]MDZ7657983.1 TIGR02452 family protein [Fodinibius sp.]
MDNKEIAQHTLQILDQQWYRSPSDDKIDLSEPLEQCINETHCYTPKQLDDIRQQFLQQPAPSDNQTQIEIRNETTLQGSRRLAAKEKYNNIGVLNFASARNPGGGFKTGAQAQEESLARSSGLYFSLKQCPSYYKYHRSHKSTLYSDRMIWSPHCPVFRTDDGTLLNQYYTVHFITSPAPNAGAVKQNEPENIPKIEPTLKERSSKILALAAHHNCDVLVLGAWGCGVFQNDPEVVAKTFKNHLGSNGDFHNRFRKVLFSVLDNSNDKHIIQAFRDQLGD